MTVTIDKIRACVGEQTQVAAHGVKDISEDVISTGVAKLKQQNLSEKHSTQLLTKFFKLTAKNGRDELIKAYAGGECTTVSEGYLSAHESTDNRVAGKDIAKGLIHVAGYSYYPSFGPYVRDKGLVIYNTWRSPVKLFGKADYRSFLEKGHRAYDDNLGKWLDTEGREGGDLSLYDAVKPDLWLAFEQLWFPNNPEHARIFTDWLSLTLTYSDLKIRWAPMIRSVQGIGKGTLVQSVIRPILGVDSVRELDFKRVIDKFSGDQFLSRLIVINEVKTTRPEHYNSLKDKVTDDYLFVERKNEQGFQSKVYFATLLYSNEHRPLWVPSGDRRYWVPDYIEYPECWGENDDERQQQSNEFFQLFRTALDDGGLKELAMFFRWNATTDGQAELHGVAPTSEAKKDIISRRTEDMLDKLALYLDDYLHSTEGFKIADLQGLYPRELSEGNVKKLVKELGYVSTRQYIGGRQMWVYSMEGKKVTDLHKPNRGL